MNLRIGAAAAIVAGAGLLLLAGCGAGPGGGVPPSATTTCTPPACIPAGPYTTKEFLDGRLTVVFGVPWQSGEDQTAEFSGAPPGTSDRHRLLFWMNVLPTGTDGQVVAGVPQTATGMVRWLRSRANLDVTAVRPTTIGAAALPAQVVDISVAHDARSEDPACPSKACVLFLTWPGAGTNLYGIQDPNVVRLYLADVVSTGSRHLFAIAVEAKDQAELDAFAPTVQPVISSMTGPLTPA